MCCVAPSSSPFGGFEKTHVFEPARYQTPAGFQTLLPGSLTKTSARWFGKA